MQTIWLTGKEPLIQDIARASFPSYHGKKFKLQITDRPINVKSYWDGGSRNTFTFLNLGTGVAQTVPTQHPFFDKQIQGADEVHLTEDVICVKHSIFCGKDMGLTIIAHPNAVNKLALPLPKDDLTEDEVTVLQYIAHLKSSYGGIKQYRFTRANQNKGITWQRWNDAKQSLIAKKHLRKNGAISPQGRNAIAPHDKAW